ncbi:MAG: hypothetical protein DSY42_04615 [Aquifex sp.]|nr:MAG: hypothetical protein DSY42_04615 [Aquifex sp.]
MPNGVILLFEGVEEGETLTPVAYSIAGQKERIIVLGNLSAVVTSDVLKHLFKLENPRIYVASVSHNENSTVGFVIGAVEGLDREVIFEAL